MKNRLTHFIIGCCILAFSNWGWTQVDVDSSPLIPPRPQAPVVDSANIISDSKEMELNSVLRELWQSGGSQVQILTLPSLGGMPIAQMAFEVAEKWTLGTEKQDNGVLLLVALEEKRIRIEVGEGLEGSLPDGSAWKIIEDSMTPLFRAGQPSAAIYVGAQLIVQKTDPQFSWTGGSRPQSTSVGQDSEARFFLILIIFIFLLHFMSQGPRGGSRTGVLDGRSGTYDGSYGADHWSGGGGFGGSGGWSGGGGGFSGGGASGGW